MQFPSKTYTSNFLLSTRQTCIFLAIIILKLIIICFRQQGAEEVPQCSMDLSPEYAVVSSCISFFLPCCVMIAIYSRLYHYAKKHVQSIKVMNVSHRHTKRVIRFIAISLTCDSCCYNYPGERFMLPHLPSRAIHVIAFALTYGSCCRNYHYVQLMSLHLSSHAIHVIAFILMCDSC